MGKKSIETLVGLFVLLGIAGAAVPGAEGRQPRAASAAATPTRCSAYFDNIGGLKVRAPVRSAGVTVGRVASITLDPKTYQGVGAAGDRARRAVPDATRRRKILTSGLLGDQYVGIEPGARREELRRRATTIKQTQSAVVLENLIGQFLFSKAADAGRRRPHRRRRQRGQEMTRSLARRGCRGALAGRLLAVALAGCATIAGGARRAGAAPRSVGELEPQGLQLQRDARRAVLKPVATVYTDVVPQFVRRGVGNFFANFADAWSAVNNMLQGKSQAGLEDVTRVGTNTVRPVRHARRRVARWASTITTRTSARRSAARASAPAPTWCCRCSGRRRCATRSRCRSTARGAAGLVRRHRHQVGLTLLQIINTRAEPARRDAASSTTSRSTSTPSSATPTCSGGAAWCSTATRRRPRHRSPTAAPTAAGAGAGIGAAAGARHGRPRRRRHRAAIRSRRRAECTALRQASVRREADAPCRAGSTSHRIAPMIANERTAC